MKCYQDHCVGPAPSNMVFSQEVRKDKKKKRGKAKSKCRQLIKILINSQPHYQSNALLKAAVGSHILLSKLASTFFKKKIKRNAAGIVMRHSYSERRRENWCELSGRTYQNSSSFPTPQYAVSTYCVQGRLYPASSLKNEWIWG